MKSESGSLAILSQVGSCDVSDACDELGVDVVRSGALRPLWPDCDLVAGVVTTVRLDSGETTPLPALLDVLAGASGQLIFIDLGGRLDAQCWGTVLATAALHFGVKGALINGAVRDVAGLRELGFATYGRGVYPGAIRGRVSLTAVGTPVELDGGVVESGSFVIADASGAVFLPERNAAAVVALAEDHRRLEEERLKAVTDGADPREVFVPS